MEIAMLAWTLAGLTVGFTFGILASKARLTLARATLDKAYRVHAHAAELYSRADEKLRRLV